MRKFTENGPELKAGLRCAFQWNEFWNDPAEISPLGDPGCKNRTQEKNRVTPVEMTGLPFASL
jgi:hypothetical protein